MKLSFPILIWDKMRRRILHTSTGTFIMTSQTNLIRLPHDVIISSEKIFLNKAIQKRGLLNDYTIFCNMITFTFDLQIKDEVIINYSYWVYQ